MSPDLLEEILVETRPVPDPAWAAELDERVERDFERAPRASSWRRRLRPSLLPALGLATSAVLVVGIGVALRGGDSESLDAAGRVAMETAREPSAVSAGSEAAPSKDREAAGGVSAESLDSTARSTGPASPGGGAVPGERRKVERLASLTLVAPPDEIPALGDRVIAVTDRLGGYVATSTVSSGEDGGGGTFDLKIPVGRLDRAMADLSELAHVSQRSQSTQDITGQFRSARGTVRELRAEREALLRALAAADTINETESVRARLRLVNNRLDGARRALRQVDRRADYASLSVSLAADADAPGAGGEDDGAWTPGDALRDAGRVLEVAAGVAIIALAAAVPLALLALLAGLVARRSVRRRREAALDAPA